MSKKYMILVLKSKSPTALIAEAHKDLAQAMKRQIEIAKANPKMNVILVVVL